MVGPAYDFLVNPLGAVRSTFEKAIASGSDPASLNGNDWGAVHLFRQFLFDHNGLSQVPFLSGETVRWTEPYTLVRFRGMIQDMLGNEFYVGAYKDGLVWRTNKFRDVSQCPVSSSADTRIWERRLLNCVPVPGLNTWAEVSSEAFKDKLMDWSYRQRGKRRRIDHESTDCEVFDNEVEGSPDAKKTRADQQSSHASQTRGPVLQASGSSISLTPNLDGNLPPCLVKAPYLHCIIHRKLAAKDFLHNNPIVELKPDSFKEMRNGLLKHLTSVLGNDDLAAQFMLLHLLSRVYSRVDTLAVGKLSLNLTCFSKEIASVFGNQLTTSIKNILPFSCCIPLTVDYLNTASLAPRKDYDNNRLVTGVLQLAEGSHVTFDETELKPGTLNSVGVENARLLKNFMEMQQVEYDFKFYKMEMPADIQMLVLSEEKSNILPADVIVPFQPSDVNRSEAIVEEAVEAFRWYLATVKLLPNSIGSEMQKVVEKDLVAARRADRSLNPQDFSRWLTMARLMSLSFGDSNLSLEHWQMIKEIERLRKERLK